jgi:hypothetical protein
MRLRCVIIVGEYREYDSTKNSSSLAPFAGNLHEP